MRLYTEEPSCTRDGHDMTDPHILVINSGSSSLKFSVYDMRGEREIAAGKIEHIGERSREGAAGPADHRAALAQALAGIADRDAIVAVGHRVVHGGERFLAPARMDAATLAELARVDALAPLHNPANRLGIALGMELLPGRVHVAVFDTAFHHSLPPAARHYAVPAEWRARGVRRYGFHGTSHRYVSREAARMLGKTAAETNLISLHLGNGCSVTAVRGGLSVDTSMGMTPLEGLVMGTRPGDIDAGALLHLLREGMAPQELDEALNHHSGLRGLCGENDMRAVHALAAAGNADAALAIEAWCYRVRKYLGAYGAVLGRVDALVFTAGIGEHDPDIRARVLAGLEWFGVRLDAERNRACRGQRAAAIHAPSSRVAILVIPTNEELEIAREVLGLLEP
jgi:acetate kinase